MAIMKSYVGEAVFVSLADNLVAIRPMFTWGESTGFGPEFTRVAGPVNAATALVVCNALVGLGYQEI